MDMTSEQTTSLRRLRRKWMHFWFAAIVFPFAALASIVISYKSHDTIASAISLLAMLLLCATYLRIALARCPRCGVLFYFKNHSYFRHARSCWNCELRL